MMEHEFVTLVLYVHNTPGIKPFESCEDERVVSCLLPERGMIAVMDGCGGAGAERYARAENWSGAKLASHVTGESICYWFDNPALLPNLPKNKALKTVIQNRLTEVYLQVKPEVENQVVIRGMLRNLPTTLAVVTAEAEGAKKANITSFWAGNTRNYILNASGLRQISVDDYSEKIDPYEDLTKDGILSNNVSAEEDFEIHMAEFDETLPCVILCASDGVFSYFDTPLRLEWILLDTMQEAKSPKSWEDRLREVLADFSSDDHTLQMAVLGFQSFKEMQAVFQPRWREMLGSFIMPLEEVAEEDYDRLNRELWNRYKQNYLAVRQE